MRTNKVAVKILRIILWCGFSALMLVLTPERYGVSTALLLPVCVLLCRWLPAFKSAALCCAAWLVASVAMTAGGWATGSATAVGAMAVHPVGVVLICIVVVLVALGSSGLIRDRT